MKLSNILLGAAALSCLAACEMKDELTGGSEKTDMGQLRLNVQAQVPAAMTRATVSTDDFPVSIAGVAGTATEEVVKSYATVGDVPAEVLLPVGQYTVSSHTPGTLEKIMDAPYYGGETAMTITKDVTTQATVKCRMQNSRIRMVYSSAFIAAFSQWTITLDDGQPDGVVLSYTEANKEPDDVFAHFEDAVTTITVNIRATTINGTTVSKVQELTKSNVTENYPDVENDNFCGGDALYITMSPTESATGEVPGITINADIQFEEYDEPVNIPVEDVDEPDEPDNPDDPDDPDDSEGPITITENGTSYLEDGVVYVVGTEAPTDVTLYMTFENGLQNMFVKVDSTDETFMSLVGGMGLVEGQGLDLTSPEAEELSAIFPLPEVGADTYTFNLSAMMFNLMGSFEGTHSFILTAYDTTGEDLSKTLKVTIISETE